MNEFETQPPELPPAPAAVTDASSTTSTRAPRRWRRLILWTVGICAASLVALLLLSHIALLLFIDQKTPDYVVVGADTISMVERTLYNPELDQEVVLIGMAHIGNDEFYQAINNRMSDDGLILWEGVTDNHAVFGRTVEGNPYEGLGNSLGLTQQKRFDFPKERMIWADLDASALKPESIKILTLVFSMVSDPKNRDAMKESLAEFAKIEENNPGVEARLMQDLIETRNDRLLEVIAEQSEADRLFVPWGAWHLPGVEEALLKNGFSHKAEIQRPITTMTRIYSGVLRTITRGLHIAEDAR